MCSTHADANELGLTDKNQACSCGAGGHAKSNSVESDHAESNHAESNRAESNRAESNRAESTHAEPDGVSDGVIREHYLVDGMTCSHCVSSVTEEVSALDGVEDVKVALNAGGTSRVMVVSSRPIDPEAIRGAVTEAGYSLVSA
jgi:copper chaperone CopZ